MPSLFRFLFLIGILGGIVVGAMVALDVFVEPVPREISERVPPNRMPR